jgi:hypothetical protein
MAMISGSLLEVACIYLSRVHSLLRTHLAIAEYGRMACSIPSREPSKKGTEARGIIVSLVDVFGPIKGPNDSWVGLAPYWLTAPTYSERGEQFETYQSSLCLVSLLTRKPKLRAPWSGVALCIRCAPVSDPTKRHGRGRPDRRPCPPLGVRPGERGACVGARGLYVSFLLSTTR